jgi:hypothetical protein
MEYIVSVVASISIFCYYYKDVLPLKKEIKQIRIDMADEKIWEKLDKLSERMNKIEIKLASLDARLFMIVGGLGIGIQIVFKYVLK